MKNWTNKFLVKFGSTVAALALMVTACNVNTACCWISHQPEMPQGAEKLKKFN